MEAHQQRVVDEKKELDEKLSKLCAFVTSSPVFQKLDAGERQRLESQVKAMDSYSLILGERIKHF